MDCLKDGKMIGQIKKIIDVNNRKQKEKLSMCRLQPKSCQI